MKLAEQRKKIKEKLDALKIFSNTATVRKLRQELEEKLRSIDVQLKRGKQVTLPIPKDETERLANAARAAKLRKYHNYLRQIRNSYPDLKYADIRRRYHERKKGRKSKIPDVIWRNPSP